MVEDTISIILTVYNQEAIIGLVFSGIAENISELTKEIIVIIDGCTDKSEENIRKELYKSPVPVNFIYTPDLNEVKANNVGLKASKCKYSIIVQDDCRILEKNFDARLLKPFKIIPNLFEVSGRDAVDTKIVNGAVDFYNCGGADVNTPHNIFSLRDVVNRGPLMIDNDKLKQLNYLNEDFAPLSQDDTDLSMRGYEKFGYLVGSYVINFESVLMWGKTRNDIKSAIIFNTAERLHLRMIAERHYSFITAPKHSQDIIIE